MREPGWFSLLVTRLDVWLRLGRHRPRLRAGVGVEVLVWDPDPRWEPRSFVAWIDNVRACSACGSVESTFDMVVLGNGGQREIIRDAVTRWRLCKWVRS